MSGTRPSRRPRIVARKKKPSAQTVLTSERRQRNAQLLDGDGPEVNGNGRAVVDVKEQAIAVGCREDERDDVDRAHDRQRIGDLRVSE
jgi:hypothetical protein